MHHYRFEEPELLQRSSRAFRNCLKIGGRIVDYKEDNLEEDRQELLPRQKWREHCLSSEERDPIQKWLR